MGLKGQASACGCCILQMTNIFNGKVGVSGKLPYDRLMYSFKLSVQGATACWSEVRALIVPRGMAAVDGNATFTS